MNEIKIYQIKGTAVFNLSEFPTKQKFVKYIRAINEKQAIEYVYAQLGSKNKIKRSNIKIEEIKEIDPNEIQDRTIKDIGKLDKIVL